MVLLSKTLFLKVIPKLYYFSKHLFHFQTLVTRFILNLRGMVGLSTAYFKRTAVTESGMPTCRAKAAFRYLMAKNKYYRKYWEIQKERLENDRILTISSLIYLSLILASSARCIPYCTQRRHSRTQGFLRRIVTCRATRRCGPYPSVTHGR